jgi:hypothetical protein
MNGRISRDVTRDEGVCSSSLSSAVKELFAAYGTEHISCICNNTLIQYA